MESDAENGNDEGSGEENGIAEGLRGKGGGEDTSNPFSIDPLEVEVSGSCPELEPGDPINVFSSPKELAPPHSISNLLALLFSFFLAFLPRRENDLVLRCISAEIGVGSSVNLPAPPLAPALAGRGSGESGSLAPPFSALSNSLRARACFVHLSTIGQALTLFLIKVYEDVMGSETKRLRIRLYPASASPESPKKMKKIMARTGADHLLIIKRGYWPTRMKSARGY